MKKNFFLAILCTLLLTSYTRMHAQDHMNMGKDQSNHNHTLLNTSNLQWKEGPASLPPGSKIAAMEGDMSKEGPFTVRLMLPKNYKISPHWHPAIEHVSVIKGAFYMGAGEQFNEGTATKLSEGGFAVMPIRTVHYAFTKKNATIQLHGVGPWGITYVNPADDPRKK